MDTILLYVTAGLTALIAYLQLTAPRTKTLADDKALAVAEKAKSALEAVKPPKK